MIKLCQHTRVQLRYVLVAVCGIKTHAKKKKWSSNEVVSKSEVEQAFFFFLFSLKFHTLVKNLKAGEKVKTSQRIWTLCLLTYFDTKKKSSDSSQLSHK